MDRTRSARSPRHQLQVFAADGLLAAWLCGDLAGGLHEGREILAESAGTGRSGYRIAHLDGLRWHKQQRGMGWAQAHRSILTCVHPDADHPTSRPALSNIQ